MATVIFIPVLEKKSKAMAKFQLKSSSLSELENIPLNQFDLYKPQAETLPSEVIEDYAGMQGTVTAASITP